MGSPVRQLVAPLVRRYRAGVTERDQRRQLRELDDRLAAAPPVVVFQMGKVASSTIYESLRRDYPGVVVHTHAFFRRHPDPVVARLAQEFHAGRPYRFIAPVRAPIERNFSDFFENYERYVGVDFARDRSRSTAELARLFLDRFPHDLPARWFDQTLRPSIGIDVYAESFGSGGWQRYENGRRVSLLVLRSELPNPALARIVANFSGLDGMTLHERNRGGRKRYGASYRRFLAEVRFPRAFVQRMCATRYFETFYGEPFRAEALRRWAEPAPATQPGS